MQKSVPVFVAMLWLEKVSAELCGCYVIAHSVPAIRKIYNDFAPLAWHDAKASRWAPVARALCLFPS